MHLKQKLQEKKPDWGLNLLLRTEQLMLKISYEGPMFSNSTYLKHSPIEANGKLGLHPEPGTIKERSGQKQEPDLVLPSRD